MFYESPNVVDNVQTLYIDEELFSIEEIEFRLKWLEKGKSKDTEG